MRCAEFLAPTRRFTTDVERVLVMPVANRAIDPISKLAAADWVCHHVAIPGLDRMDVDQAYRAMDLLIEADTDARVQEAVFFAVAAHAHVGRFSRRRLEAAVRAAATSLRARPPPPVLPVTSRGEPGRAHPMSHD